MTKSSSDFPKALSLPGAFSSSACFRPPKAHSSIFRQNSLPRPHSSFSHQGLSLCSDHTRYLADTKFPSLGSCCSYHLQCPPCHPHLQQCHLATKPRSCLPSQPIPCSLYQIETNIHCLKVHSLSSLHMPCWLGGM